MHTLKKVLRFIALTDFLLFCVTVPLVGSIEYFHCHYKSMPIFPSEDLNEDGGVKIDPKNSYDLIIDILYSHGSRGNVYTAYFMIIMALGTAYGTIEIWLFCVLFKGSMKKERVTGCKRWLFIRSAFLIISSAFIAVDIVQLRYTCSEIAVFPIGFFRFWTLFVVLYCYLKLRKIEKSKDPKSEEKDTPM